jgi:hypothetical protein
VPDEDLYEQGIWPSAYNREHNYTFTIYKSSSWSPVSVNILDLLSSLPDAEIIKIELQDDGYDYSPEVLASKADQTLGEAEAQIVFVLRKTPGTERKGADYKRPPLFLFNKFFIYIKCHVTAPLRNLRKRLWKRLRKKK